MIAVSIVALLAMAGVSIAVAAVALVENSHIKAAITEHAVRTAKFRDRGLTAPDYLNHDLYNKVGLPADVLKKAKEAAK